MSYGKGGAAAASPSATVFIGDLPDGTDEAGVTQIFQAYGSVVSCKAFPPKSPGFKASCVVTFGSVEEAQWLVNNVNGNIPSGLSDPVVVRFKTDKSAKGGGDWGKGGGASYQAPVPYSAPAKGGGGGGKGDAPSPTVFIGDLPAEVADDQTVMNIFGKYGSVSSCKAFPPKQPGSKAACVVTFASVAEAQWLVDNVNGNVPEGLSTPVVVKFKRQDGAGKGGDKGGYEQPSWNSGSYGKSAGKGDSWKGGGYGKSDGKGDKGKSKGKGKSSASGCDIRDVIKGLGKHAKLPEDNQCYITGLPYNTTDLDLYKLFSQYGAIPSSGVKVMIGGDGSCTGIGFVDYIDAASAEMAILSMNQAQLPDGSYLSVAHKRVGGGKGKDQ